eukprot:TRINITY_DN116477_c0_g1_i1.p1 TRINITY_DN116477_c0_g1~~TRINITY_DN116477_c0_g1_i1.p1  ORF type:complete len:322 (-),score=45.72 TRINITY_DN116477_c0_g1_i1:48-1013(-)
MPSAIEMETLVAASCFGCCSVGMMLFNKLAVQALPLECLLVAAQMAFSALALGVFAFRSIHIGSCKDLARWCIVTPFFAGMLLTSILALKNAPMSLVIVFRTVSPVGAVFVERFYPEPVQVTSGIIGSIGLMIAGSIMYAKDMPQQHLIGVGWVLLNSIISIFDKLLQSLMLRKDQAPVDISKSGVTLINNFLGMIPILIAGFCLGEFEKLPHAVSEITFWGWAWIVLSCVIGLGISYSGVWSQSLISATSMLVLINANKFIIILIEVFCMHKKTMTSFQLAGALLTVFAGALYGKVRSNLERDVAEKKALLSKNQAEKSV